MNNNYHVIWIDDEYEDQSLFIEECLDTHKIEIKPFKVRKEGIQELLNNINYWEAIILDAKCLNESEDEVASLEGLREAREAILEVKNKNNIPIFIYTGQTDYIGSEMFEASFGKYYRKGTDKDRLKDDIVSAIENKMSRVIREKYSNIFSWYSNPNELIKILSYVELDKNNDTEVFNIIRKELEELMRRLEDYGILAVHFNDTNLNNCSRFLGLNEMTKYIPIYVQRAFYSCITVANHLSHSLSGEKDVREGKAPYLIKSTIFEFLNILTWENQLPKDTMLRSEIQDFAKKVVNDFKESPDVEKGLIYEPEIDKYGNLHVGNCFLYHLNNENMAVVKQKIKKRIIVSVKENTDKRTKDLYHFFAKTDEV